ncbi:hypothetical protein [Longimicrobium sp.]|uniref:hypothetical protein n=1 Tax=Longimicrobium sp. TaxID=2029185 RepID=UPI002E2F75EC|nr:hypothetical protein [Longimicrobium sp.]HEX6037844.1 hypothetical protein [Longimicrobium sp.]
MRLPSILVLAVTLLAAPLAAQEPAPSARPLPTELAPRRADVGSVRSARWDDHLELGVITGMLVGMTVGGTYGSLTYEDRCARQEDECMFTRGVETSLFAILGGGLGALIGGGTMALLDHRDSRRRPPAPLTLAPLTIVPDATGAMRVEVVLRH